MSFEIAFIGMSVVLHAKKSIIFIFFLSSGSNLAQKNERRGFFL